MTQPDTLVEAVNALAREVVHGHHGGPKLDYDEVVVRLQSIVATQPLQNNNLLTTLDRLGALLGSFLSWMKHNERCVRLEDLQAVEHRLAGLIKKCCENKPVKPRLVVFATGDDEPMEGKK